MSTSEGELLACTNLDKTYFTFGDVKGTLERVNIHDRHDFYLYPEMGEGAVVCHFKADHLLEKVMSSLGKCVIATGILKFIGSDVDPVAATIDDIEIIPDDYHAPKASELFGIAPNLTANKDITDYIRDIRNEWDRHL